jgi:uncharacterized protein YukE
MSKGFKLAKSDRLTTDLLGSLPAAFATQKEQLTRLQTELVLCERRTEELDSTIDRLQSEIRTIKEQSDVLAKENAELRSAWDGNSDQQRHASLVDRLTEQTRLIVQVSRQVGNIRSELIYDIRAELQNRGKLPSEQLQPSLTQAGSSGHPSRKPPSPTSYNGGWNWPIFVLIAFAVVVVALAIWAAVQFWP